MEDSGSENDDQSELSARSGSSMFHGSEFNGDQSECSSVHRDSGVRAELYKLSREIKLSAKQCLYLAAVLQDTVCQIVILNNCNRELLEDMLNRANVKKWTPQGDNVPPEDRLEKVDLQELASDSHKLAKMESDRKYIMETIISIYLDLKNNGSFPTLLVQLSDLAAKAYQAITRELQYNNFRTKLKEFQMKIRKDASVHKKILNKCEVEIYRLLDEIDDSTWNSEIKTRYIEGWENAQIEQHSLAIQQTEGVLEGSVTGTELRIEQENRINNEIESFIKHTIQDYSDQIEYWMKNYDDELEQLDIDIRVMKEKRETQLEATAALEKMKADHKREMDEWVAFITERARLKALEELRLRSAIRIQAWWRGIIIRRMFAKLKKKMKKLAKKAAAEAKKKKK